MKKLLFAATALTALAATPAFAGGTHISVGFYSPAPVYYQPAPVVYYPPVQHVYYAPPRPPRPPCPPQRVVYNDYYYHGNGHHHGHGGYNRNYQTAYGYGYGVSGGWH